MVAMATVLAGVIVMVVVGVEAVEVVITVVLFCQSCFVNFRGVKTSHR